MKDDAILMKMFNLNSRSDKNMYIISSHEVFQIHNQFRKSDNTI